MNKMLETCRITYAVFCYLCGDFLETGWFCEEIKCKNLQDIMNTASLIMFLSTISCPVATYPRYFIEYQWSTKLGIGISQCYH